MVIHMHAWLTWLRSLFTWRRISSLLILAAVTGMHKTPTPIIPCSVSLWCHLLPGMSLDALWTCDKPWVLEQRASLSFTLLDLTEVSAADTPLLIYSLNKPLAISYPAKGRTAGEPVKRVEDKTIYQAASHIKSIGHALKHSFWERIYLPVLKRREAF